MHNKKILLDDKIQCPAERRYSMKNRFPQCFGILNLWIWFCMWIGIQFKSGRNWVFYFWYYSSKKYFLSRKMFEFLALWSGDFFPEIPPFWRVVAFISCKKSCFQWRLKGLWLVIIQRCKAQQNPSTRYRAQLKVDFQWKPFLPALWSSQSTSV
jgi:hypothetical protein